MARSSPATVCLEVLKIGRPMVVAVAALPTHGDDVDPEDSRARSQGRFEASQATFDAVELCLGDTAFGGRMVATCLDLDGAVGATAPCQDVNLAARQRQVARNNAIPRPSQRAACEVFTVLTGCLGGIAGREIASRNAATYPFPLPVRHERCAIPRCDRT